MLETLMLILKTLAIVALCLILLTIIISILLTPIQVIKDKKRKKELKNILETAIAELKEELANDKKQETKKKPRAKKEEK